MQKLRQHAALIIWSVITGYTFYVIIATPVMMQHEHLLNLLMLGIAIVFQFVRGNLAKIVPLFTMAGAMFVCAAFTPLVYFFAIGSLVIGLPYVILILLFLLFNRKELPGWWQEIF